MIHHDQIAFININQYKARFSWLAINIYIIYKIEEYITYNV